MFLGKVMGIIKNKKIISFESVKTRLINRFISIIAPLVSSGAKIYKFFIH
ncbi:MAG: hypothetical protein ABIH08_03845 [Candidatus Omnitrophota bacterium]